MLLHLPTPEDRLPGAQGGSKVLHEQHETHFVNGRRAETEAEVEGARSGVNCLHQDSADTHRLGGLLGSQKRILQQGGAQTFSLLRLIDGEASKHHNTDGMSGETVADTFGSLRPAYAAGREGVVANDHTVATVGDVDAGGVVLDIDPSKALEPKVQGFLAAIEAAQVVVFGKLLNDEFGACHHQRLSATEPRANRRFSPGGILGGASSALTKAFHALGGNGK